MESTSEYRGTAVFEDAAPDAAVPRGAQHDWTGTAGGPTLAVGVCDENGRVYLCIRIGGMSALVQVLFDLREQGFVISRPGNAAGIDALAFHPEARAPMLSDGCGAPP